MSYAPRISARISTRSLESSTMRTGATPRLRTGLGWVGSFQVRRVTSARRIWRFRGRSTAMASSAPRRSSVSEHCEGPSLGRAGRQLHNPPKLDAEPFCDARLAGNHNVAVTRLDHHFD